MTLSAIHKVIANVVFPQRGYRSPLRPMAKELKAEIDSLREQGMTFDKIGKALARKHGRLKPYGSNTIRDVYRRKAER